MFKGMGKENIGERRVGDKGTKGIKERRKGSKR
jgi:hypothetical protein